MSHQTEPPTDGFAILVARQAQLCVYLPQAEYQLGRDSDALKG